MADHRIPARPDEVATFAEALAGVLGSEGSGKAVPPAWEKHLQAIVADLQQNKGQSIVMVGDAQPPEVHRLGHAINVALGNVGKTVYYTEPVESFPEDEGHKPITGIDSLRDLTADMNAGKVGTLLIFGQNPVYTAPADLRFGDALFRLSRPQDAGSARFENFTAYLGQYNDETSYLCQWQLPQSHYLESWGDIRAFDGTASIIQPLIGPMNEGRSASRSRLKALPRRPATKLFAATGRS